VDLAVSDDVVVVDDQGERLIERDQVVDERSEERGGVTEP